MFVTLLIAYSLLQYSHGDIKTYQLNIPNLSTQLKKYHFLVTVITSPTVKKTNHIAWKVSYITFNRKCYKAKNMYTKFEGGVFPKKITDTGSASLNKRRSLNIDILLNKYEPGSCQWGIQSISYSINNSPYFTLAKFSNKSLTSNSIMNTETICLKTFGKYTCSKIMGSRKQSQAILTPKKNYSATIYIKGEK